MKSNSTLFLHQHLSRNNILHILALFLSYVLNRRDERINIVIMIYDIGKSVITKFTYPIGTKGHIRDQFLFNSLWDAMFPYIRKFG